MRDRLVGHPNLHGLVGVVGLPAEEYLPGLLLTDLPREVRRPESAVEARHVWVGLEELRVLRARERQVTDHVERVPAADRPPGNDRDHGLRHESDQPLDLQNVESAGARLAHERVVALVGLVVVAVLVARLAADGLVAAGRERAAAVLGGAVAGQEDTAHVGLAFGVVQCDV